MSAELENLVKTIVVALVDLPDEVKVSSIQGQKVTVLEVQVAKSDVGKVIGRKGSTADAIRLLLTNAAGKLKTNATLEILEPEEGK